MKKVYFGIITILVGLTITGLVLTPYLQTYFGLTVGQIETSTNQNIALNLQENTYQDYLQNISAYTDRYEFFKKESLPLLQQKINQNTEPQTDDIEEFIRIPKNFTPVTYSNTDITKQVLQQAEIGKASPKIEMQSLPSTVGFSSTSIANGATNINVYQQFNVVFPSIPTQETINRLQFFPEVNFTKVVNGNTVTITPMKMKRNTNYTFGVPGGLEICGLDNCSTKTIWSHGFSFKTSLKEAILSGFTVNGLPIFAFAYGNADDAGKSILLTGATHGEEWHAGGLWNWLGWMEANNQELANQNKEILIITEINRDGADRQRASRRFNNAARYNSRGVNLNRNFPNQWSGCTICGSSPGSEPETQAVMGVSLVENVTHMIAYHNQWPPVGIIFLGDNGNPTTVAWAQWAGAKTGYPVGIYSGPEVNTTSSGDVPGDQVVWAESVGIRGLLIEGSYRGVDDYGKNFPMYLALVREF